MTAIKSIKPEWLKEQIESGVQGYLECEIERISALVTKYVVQQIIDNLYLHHSEWPVDEDAEANIRIAIPDPYECLERLNSSERPSDWYLE